MSTSGKVYEDLDLIAAQREAGWPDMHPEDLCHRCGNPNPSWHAETEEWYSAMQVRDTDGGGIVCPTCFIDLWERQNGRRILWLLTPYPGEPLSRPL